MIAKKLRSNEGARILARKHGNTGFRGADANKKKDFDASAGSGGSLVPSSVPSNNGDATATIASADRGPVVRISPPPIATATATAVGPARAGIAAPATADIPATHTPPLVEVQPACAADTMTRRAGGFDNNCRDQLSNPNALTGKLLARTYVHLPLN